MHTDFSESFGRELAHLGTGLSRSAGEQHECVGCNALSPGCACNDHAEIDLSAVRFRSIFKNTNGAAADVATETSNGTRLELRGLRSGT